MVPINQCNAAYVLRLRERQIELAQTMERCEASYRAAMRHVYST